MDDSLWKPIDRAKRTGRVVWLGWKPFRDQAGVILSEVVPRVGMWDCGSRQWVSHFEDHGDADGHRPLPFVPQPDYLCNGYIPPAPTI